MLSSILTASTPGVVIAIENRTQNVHTSRKFGFETFRHFFAESEDARGERRTERKGSLDLHDQRQSERGGVREREGD